MSLFNESLESIAQAIVTVNRALKAGVIEKENYQALNTYLNRRATDFKVKKSHIAKAKKLLKDELQSEVDEFFMDEDDALYKMAEEILEDYEGNVPDEQDDDEMLRAEEATAREWIKQDACRRMINMNDEEFAELAVLHDK